jgi:hypothetical protein
MMFKFELEQLVWYMKDNKAHNAPVLSRMYIDNLHPTWTSTPQQCQSFTRFGPNQITYATIHGEYNENDLYASKEEMYQALIFK